MTLLSCCGILKKFSKKNSMVKNYGFLMTQATKVGRMAFARSDEDFDQLPEFVCESHVFFQKA
ncbi:MAG: hypothetical protein FWH27_11500 [Planctomycetaceae bacterium]|nr:hypothetical protein [Planctomycetaceae bacterium]